MNREETIRKIVEAAEYCEHFLCVEADCFVDGDFERCAIFAEFSEREALYAFELASRR